MTILGQIFLWCLSRVSWPPWHILLICLDGELTMKPGLFVNHFPQSKAEQNRTFSSFFPHSSTKLLLCIYAFVYFCTKLKEKRLICTCVSCQCSYTSHMNVLCHYSINCILIQLITLRLPQTTRFWSICKAQIIVSQL